MPLDPEHIFDPDGDVTLVLQDEIPPFAVWITSEDPEPADEIPPAPVDFEDAFDEVPDAAPPVDNADDEPSLEIRENSTDEDEENNKLDILSTAQDESDHTEPSYSIEMKVSSRHLILASPMFRTMLTGKWNESEALQSQQPVRLQVDDWDANAMCILMNIIHGKTRRVLRSIDLDVLAKMSVLVDYYECLEVVEVYSNMWITNLEHTMPKTYCRDLILWILISYVFRRPRLFETATYTALTCSKGPIDTMGLPIPPGIISTIEERREIGIGQIIYSLHDFHDELLNGSYGCGSFPCSSMLLGAHIKNLTRLNLFRPMPLPPYCNISLTGLMDDVREMSSPQWCDRSHSYSYHGCSIESKMQSITEPLKDQAPGLKLKKHLPCASDANGIES